jgi:hypothetical protein
LEFEFFNEFRRINSFLQVACQCQWSMTFLYHPSHFEPEFQDEKGGLLNLAGRAAIICRLAARFWAAVLGWKRLP